MPLMNQSVPGQIRRTAMAEAEVARRASVDTPGTFEESLGHVRALALDRLADVCEVFYDDEVFWYSTFRKVIMEVAEEVHWRAWGLGHKEGRSRFPSTNTDTDLSV